MHLSSRSRRRTTFFTLPYEIRAQIYYLALLEIHFPPLTIRNPVVHIEHRDQLFPFLNDPKHPVCQEAQQILLTQFGLRIASPALLHCISPYTRPLIKRAGVKIPLRLWAPNVKVPNRNKPFWTEKLGDAVKKVRALLPNVQKLRIILENSHNEAVGEEVGAIADVILNGLEKARLSSMSGRLVVQVVQVGKWIGWAGLITHGRGRKAEAMVTEQLRSRAGGGLEVEPKMRRRQGG